MDGHAKKDSDISQLSKEARVGELSESDLEQVTGGVSTIDDEAAMKKVPKKG